MSNYICNIRCSYRQPSGYCGITGGYETCQYRQIHVPPLKKTNADRIRSMTDEELAKWRSRGQCPTGHYHGDYDCMNRSCKDCWLEWLKENDEI